MNKIEKFIKPDFQGLGSNMGRGGPRSLVVRGAAAVRHFTEILREDKRWSRGLQNIVVLGEEQMTACD